MTKQELLVKSLMDKWECYLEQFPEDKSPGIIHILATSWLEQHEEAEYYKKLWNTEFSKR